MKTLLIPLGALTLTLILTACAPLSPNLDSRFGDTVNLLRAQQIIDVQASANTREAPQDGVAAREAVDQYYKSYRAPTPQPSVFTIGVGGGSY